VTALHNNFGGSGITLETFGLICALLPGRATVLELGGGLASTRYLSERYKVYTVEDSEQWLKRCPEANYIYAPLDHTTNWYYLAALERELPKEYDLILVDGPTGSDNRIGFLNNFGMFRHDVPIVVDDTDRVIECKMLFSLAEKLGRTPNLVGHCGYV
jgi:hypothetical protein